jgi:DNA-binding CsgD family transcriptional regulator
VNLSFPDGVVEAARPSPLPTTSSPGERARLRERLRALAAPRAFALERGPAPGPAPARREASLEAERLLDLAAQGMEAAVAELGRAVRLLPPGEEAVQAQLQGASARCRELLERIRSLAAGLEGRSRAASTPQPPGGRGEPTLTARELEIARYLAEGKSNWCVATILEISCSTVETHRRNLMQKLGLQSIVELVHHAVRTGLIEP